MASSRYITNLRHLAPYSEMSFGDIKERAPADAEEGALYTSSVTPKSPGRSQRMICMSRHLQKQIPSMQRQIQLIHPQNPAKIGMFGGLQISMGFCLFLLKLNLP